MKRRISVILPRSSLNDSIPPESFSDPDARVEPRGSIVARSTVKVVLVTLLSANREVETKNEQQRNSRVMYWIKVCIIQMIVHENREKSKKYSTFAKKSFLYIIRFEFIDIDPRYILLSRIYNSLTFYFYPQWYIISYLYVSHFSYTPHSLTPHHRYCHDSSKMNWTLYRTWYEWLRQIWASRWWTIDTSYHYRAHNTLCDNCSCSILHCIVVFLSLLSCLDPGSKKSSL